MEAGLPAIATELESLRSIYGARAAILTPTELFERLAQPGELSVAALHLAAHGSFQPEHPLFSGLRLGERFLTAFDLSRLRLTGTLVSLSGCETGRARRSRSDELYGPEQALLRAGAGAVVSSLWPVEDQASASAMLALHRGLAAGLGLRQAMREAQLLERRRDPHPFGWAAFLATGAPDWRLA
jgi:CHAT domain-containing protein